MTLPYSMEVLFAILAQYNRALWPAPPLAALLALGVLALTLRPVRGGDRAVGGVLALFWIWVGAVYQLGTMAPIDFAAPLYGALWIAQGLLLAWTGVLRRRLAFRFAGGGAAWAGLGLALFALVGHPLIVVLMGYGWQAMPLVGLAPGPTAIFTMGLLLLTAGRVPRVLIVLPLLWAGVAAMTGWFLAFWLDFAVPLAVLAAIALLVWKSRRAGARPEG